MGCGGVVVCSVPCYRRITGSNPWHSSGSLEVWRLQLRLAVFQCLGEGFVEAASEICR